MTPSTMRAAAALAVMGALALAAPAEARWFKGPVEKACLKSGRDAATPQMCQCIQRVADAVLDRTDQRLAASFFRDPHLAQEVRQSDLRGHAEFWQRYKVFGAAAERNCG